jgi:hypothetical protein
MRPASRFQFLLLGLVFSLSCGCIGSSPRMDRYIPSKAAARHALELALKAWQNGETSERIEIESPAIQVVDSQRKADQRLERFEILGEVPGDSPRCLAVRLTLDNPREARTVRYVVLGIDPLLVISYHDFVMLTHWDMNMADQEPKRVSKR